MSEAEKTREPHGARPKSTPGEALVWALGKRHAEQKVVFLNPKSDKLWAKRENGKLILAAAKISESWPVSRGAWLEIGAILGVAPALMDRLSRLPKDEDCRLANVLLWDKGSEDGWKLRLVIHNGIVSAATLGDYKSLSAERLARTLERLESSGAASVAKWDLHDLGWWVVVKFDRHEPLDLSQGSTSEPDLWDRGALLFNHEDGKTAAAVVPGLIRRWGKYWLPVAQGTVRRHDGGGDALVDAIKALQVAEGAPFNEAAGKMRAIQGSRAIDADNWLGRLTSPWTEAQRQATRAAGGQGRVNGYQMVTAAMRIGYHIEDPVKRLACLRALGNLLMEGKAGKQDK